MSAPLAPALGRLGAPPADSPWDAIRLDMVHALVTAHADGALDGPAWLAAWAAAVARLRDQVLGDAASRLHHAAMRSRMPANRLEPQLPDAVEADRLLQRLLAEAVALEALEEGGDDPALQRRRGAALEQAWDAAVNLARTESGRYRQRAARIAEWRRPWTPLVLAGGIGGCLALLAAAMIAGVLPAPAWFRPVVDAFWSLPWP